MTALHYAALAGWKNVVELLLASGADADAKEEHGRTALHLAAIAGRADIAEQLLAHKADPNAKAGYKTWALLGDAAFYTLGWEARMTPLDVAIYSGHKDVAELLLANQADLNAKDSAGRTPLHWAAMWARKDILELLLSKSADPSVTDNNGATAADLAAKYDHPEVAQFIRR